MVSGAIPTIQPPKSGVSLDPLVPYDVPGGYSYTPPMNTLGLLADPNIGPQSIVAVPLGGVNAFGERTGLINPAVQPETAAQQYMREVEQARQNSRSKDPSIVTNQALKTGAEQSDYTSERSMLDRMYQSGLLDTLIGMSRAERKYGVGPVAAFSEAFQDVQTARAATEAAQAKAKLELQKEQIKATPQPPKPSAEITQLYRQMGTYQTGLETFNRIKGILSKGITTGGAGAALNALTNIAAAFNINLDPSAQKSVKLAVAEIRKQLIASKAFGREANRDEQKLIRTLIPDPGIFSSIKELEEAYNNAARIMQKQANETNAIMTGVYRLPSYGTVVPTSPFFTRPNQGK